MIISYDIQRFKYKKGFFGFKNNYIHRLYKIVVSKNAIGSYKLCEGSYNDCKKYCLDHNIDLRKITRNSN